MSKKVKKLTLRERKFLWNIMHEKMSITDAYEATTNKEITRGSAAALGTRLFARIKKKAAWQEVLQSANLDEMRLATELDRMLQMKVVKHYQDREIGKFEDSTTQMRAVELLADFLGKRKTKIEHEGNVEVKMDRIIYESVHGNLKRSDMDDETT